MRLRRCVVHPTMRYPAGQDGCFLCGDEGTMINGTYRDKLFEQTLPDAPGHPTFRTKGQRDRYLRQHGLVLLGKSDLPWVKRQVERSHGRLPPKRNMKAWWRKEAEKYRGLVDQPAFCTRG